MIFSPQLAIHTLGDSFYDAVRPAAFPETTLRFRNDRAAAEIGLDHLSDADWVRHLGRFEPLPGAQPEPLALRYHGHQFRVYNPEIGDGRGFLFAQMYDEQGRLMDLGTKGSGQTPHSRSGDGRLTLKGGVREILATEMLEALGVTTSRTLSLIETGEALQRGDEPSPTRSAVLVRLNHGHIRIGTFQRLAYLQDVDGLRKLTAYALKHYYGEEAGEDAPQRLLTLVSQSTAKLAGQFIAAGFVHGVLNSDNINVSGESFDYGPWRFAPIWDPAFVAAYFDHAGLYAFGRQPEAIFWDVMQLASSLHLIAEEAPLVEALDHFAPCYQQEMVRATIWRMGLTSLGYESDLALVQQVHKALGGTRAPMDQFFFDIFGGVLPDSYPDAFDAVRSALAPYAPRKARDHAYWLGGKPCTMVIDEVERIWSAIAEQDDWNPLEQKISEIREMGEALV